MRRSNIQTALSTVISHAYTLFAALLIHFSMILQAAELPWKNAFRKNQNNNWVMLNFAGATLARYIVYKLSHSSRVITFFVASCTSCAEIRLFFVSSVSPENWKNLGVSKIGAGVTVKFKFTVSQKSLFGLHLIRHLSSEILILRIPRQRFRFNLRLFRLVFLLSA